MSTRAAAVAGRFYPGAAGALRADVEGRLGPKRRAAAPLAVVAPHAGYVYSGDTAGLLYGAFPLPDRVFLFGPNHTGCGVAAAVDPASSWETPLGRVEVDSEARRSLMESCPWLELDAAANAHEHCLEVQVPFLQVTNPRARIIGVILSWLELDELRELGRAVANVVQALPGRTLLVASSDLNHYESHEATLVKDERALEPLLALDPAGLWHRVVGERISMCGIVPTVVVLEAAIALGAKTTELVDHRTSAHAFGETDRVVGYASVWVD